MTDVVTDLVAKAKRFEPPRTLAPTPAAPVQADAEQAPRLAHVWAHDLPDDPEPEDQLVEGLIGRAAMSILYGDSNSGKTFLAIDLGRAIGNREKWMGRHTNGGLVVYLATEAPRSVVTRLQAYHRHTGQKVRNFAVVKSPINLYDGAADAQHVIDLIRQLETETAEKCALVIGDTLARLAAGANENSGEDMSAVIAHADRIRREADAHVLLVHHSGKDQAKGARGWSGLRAAIDTEIEVTVDEATGLRAAEITKQRDMQGKGERIGFRLEAVDLGPVQWGGRRTSCVVVPADAPAKASKGTRVSEIGGAILEVLRARDSGMKKRELADHFAGRYPSSSVYRELKKLQERHRIHESAGVVAYATAFEEVAA